MPEGQCHPRAPLHDLAILQVALIQLPQEPLGLTRGAGSHLGVPSLKEPPYMCSPAFPCEAGLPTCFRVLLLGWGPNLLR